jgi:hypothetical protein
MQCPFFNSVCKYAECPYYVELADRDGCVDALEKKQMLGLLTADEKMALTAYRLKVLKEQSLTGGP